MLLNQELLIVLWRPKTKYDREQTVGRDQLVDRDRQVGHPCCTLYGIKFVMFPAGCNFHVDTADEVMQMEILGK
jgi:hypothetical protein